MTRVVWESEYARRSRVEDQLCSTSEDDGSSALSEPIKATIVTTLAPHRVYAAEHDQYRRH